MSSSPRAVRRSSVVRAGEGIAPAGPFQAPDLALLAAAVEEAFGVEDQHTESAAGRRGAESNGDVHGFQPLHSPETTHTMSQGPAVSAPVSGQPAADAAAPPVSVPQDSPMPDMAAAAMREAMHSSMDHAAPTVQTEAGEWGGASSPQVSMPPPAVTQVLVDPEIQVRIFDAARREGFDRGYQEGFEEGKRDAEESARQAEEQAAEERRRRLESAVNALASALDSAEQEYAKAAIAIEGRLIDAAFRLTEALFQRELELTESVGRDAILRALNLAPGRDPVVARLHPDDAEIVDQMDKESFGRPVTVVADPAVAPADCVLEVGAAEVDASLGSAIARVRATLGMEER